MKKALAVILCLTMVLTFCGCSSKKKDTESYVTPESSDPAVNPDSPFNSGKNIEDSPFVGSFITVYCALNAATADDVYKESGDPPVLKCSEDGSFELIVYDRYGSSGDDGSGAGSVSIKGTFKVSDDTAKFTVTEPAGADFLGSDVTEFSMTLRDEDTLRYTGEQIATTVKGDLFERTE